MSDRARRRMDGIVRMLVEQAISGQGWREADHDEVVREIRQVGRYVRKLVRVADLSMLERAFDEPISPRLFTETEDRGYGPEAVIRAQPVAPGRKLDALKEIAELVRRHNEDDSFELDAEQVLERVKAAMDAAEPKEPLTVEEVKERIATMRENVEVSRYDVVRWEQLRLYHDVLEQLADEGSDVARAALGARDIKRFPAP